MFVQRYRKINRMHLYLKIHRELYVLGIEFSINSALAGFKREQTRVTNTLSISWYADTPLKWLMCNGKQSRSKWNIFIYIGGVWVWLYKCARILSISFHPNWIWSFKSNTFGQKVPQLTKACCTLYSKNQWSVNFWCSPLAVPNHFSSPFSYVFFVCVLLFGKTFR